MEMVELKLCPFCGGRASINFDSEAIIDSQGHHWAYNVVCDKCCATSGLAYSIEMAIEIWNRRVDNDLALSNT
jgi:Lar family restriction alleviation protein